MPAVPLVWSAGLTVQIATYPGAATSPEHADVALVLGAAVHAGKPSPVFEQRIRHAVDLYHAGRVDKLMLTGGVGAGDRVAESEAARAYCLAAGVAADDILLEVRSRTTLQNLLESRPVLAAEGLTTVLVVSDPLHLRRAVTLARDIGLDAHPSAAPGSRYTSLRSRAVFLMRETYFLARYKLLGRG